MTIRVWHLLVLLGIGTYGVFGGGNNKPGLLDRARGFVAGKLPFTDGLAPDTPRAEPTPVPADPNGETRLPFSEVPLTPLTPAEPATETAAPAAPVEPVSEPVVEEKKVASKPAARRRRRSTAKKAAVAPKAAARKKVVKKSADALVGSYVALTLNSGNVVKGVLLERTASNYKLELPGMGGFDYPADTVKSVTAAE